MLLLKQEERNFEIDQRLLWCKKERLDRCQEYLGKRFDLCVPCRKNKKRNFRALWIQRINAAARLEGMSYSKLMGALHKAGIEINRKVLADLAMNHPEAFKAIVAKAKAA